MIYTPVELLQYLVVSFPVQAADRRGAAEKTVIFRKG